MTYWFAFDADPEARVSEPWFEVVGTLVYPAIGHPEGRSARPWFQVRRDLVYRVGTHPESWSGEPSFRMDGDRVIPLAAGIEDSGGGFRSGSPLG